MEVAGVMGNRSGGGGNFWGATGAGSSAGDGSARERLFSICEQAVTAQVAPGVLALVRRRGSELYHEAHGFRASLGDSGRARAWSGVTLARDDVFDLASLSKVLSTTILCAQLVERGVWRLDAPLPGPFRRPYPDTTLAQLLSHCSGYPAHLRFYLDYSWPSQQSRESLMHRVLETPPEYPAGEQAIYSDLGFIVLGMALEEHYGQRLDVVFENQIQRPLGLDRDLARWVGYLPLDSPQPDLRPGLDERVLPSEVYPDPDGVLGDKPDYLELRYRWSGPEHWARGQVHDDNAYCMLGVAGHAGLFGTAAGVAEIAQAWLNAETLGLSRATVRRFGSRASQGGADTTRCLGWDGPGPGSPLGIGSVLHLGYTGTGLWMEPSRDEAIYVLLSHRVHGGRGDPNGIRALRNAFCAQARVLS